MRCSSLSDKLDALILTGVVVVVGSAVGFTKKEGWKNSCYEPHTIETLSCCLWSRAQTMTKFHTYLHVTLNITNGKRYDSHGHTRLWCAEHVDVCIRRLREPHIQMVCNEH